MDPGRAQSRSQCVLCHPDAHRAHSPQEAWSTPSSQQGRDPGLPAISQLPARQQEQGPGSFLPSPCLSPGREFRGRRAGEGFKGSVVLAPQGNTSQRAPKTAEACPQSKDLRGRAPWPGEGGELKLVPPSHSHHDNPAAPGFKGSSWKPESGFGCTQRHAFYSDRAGADKSCCRQ